jgi:hypothetical protein
MIVIGLSAKMGCGKTTLAQMLIDKWEKGFFRVAFGDLLKQECSEYFGFPLEWCYSQEGKLREIDNIDCTKPFPLLQLDRGPSVRELLQWYGTDYRRKHYPGYWIKAMREKLDNLKANHPEALVVIDDVRFPDEAELVLEYGSLFRIEPFGGWQPGPHAGHASETALDDYHRFSGIFRPAHGLEALELVAEVIMRRSVGVSQCR